MPRLILFAACEKTLHDINGPASLISIFQRMNFPVQQVPLPEKAISPNQWSIFSLWETEPEELGTVFKQTTRVYAPDGTLWLEHEMDWKNQYPEDQQIKISTLVAGMPVWSEGFVETKVWLDDAAQEAGSYRFQVRYVLANDNAVPVEAAG